MSPATPHVEDRLLDFAYGELAAAEAREVEAHLESCTDCRGALQGIQGVRKVMSRLPENAAPAAGLESLLAYAEQSARRVQAGPPPRPTWWRKLLVPLAGVSAVAAFFVVAQQAYTGRELNAHVQEAAARKAAPAPFASVAVESPPPTAGAAYRGQEVSVASQPPLEPKRERVTRREAAPLETRAAVKKEEVRSGGGLVGGVAGDSAAGPAPVRMAPKKKSVRSAPAAPAPAADDVDPRDGHHDLLEAEGHPEIASAAPAAEPAPRPDSPVAASAAPGEGPEEAMRRRSRPAAARQERPSGDVPAAQKGAAAPAQAMNDSADEEDAQMEAMVETQSTVGGRSSVVLRDAEARRWLDAARASRAAGDLEGAVDAARRAQQTPVADDRLTQEALSLLCDLEFGRGNPQAARAWCQKLIDQFPRSGAASVARRRLEQPDPAAN